MAIELPETRAMRILTILLAKNCSPVARVIRPSGRNPPLARMPKPKPIHHFLLSAINLRAHEMCAILLDTAPSVAL